MIETIQQTAKAITLKGFVRTTVMTRVARPGDTDVFTGREDQDYDVEFEITVDVDQLEALARRALGNKRRRSRYGACTAKVVASRPLGEPRSETR